MLILQGNLSMCSTFLIRLLLFLIIVDNCVNGLVIWLSMLLSAIPNRCVRWADKGTIRVGISPHFGKQIIIMQFKMRLLVDNQQNGQRGGATRGGKLSKKGKNKNSFWYPTQGPGQMAQMLRVIPRRRPAWVAHVLKLQSLDSENEGSAVMTTQSPACDPGSGENNRTIGRPKVN